MEFPKNYKALSKNIFNLGRYKIVPIRYEDRLDIMTWRNEQMYHLRQREKLTTQNQDNYFNNVIAKIFECKQPEQILFSYLENEICIGYGGLVHINWADKNAEISFIIKTSLEKVFFKYHWQIFLELIEEVAFKELKFHKVFVYAYNLRPHLYEAIEEKGFVKEAVLKEHCFFENSFLDVIIHSKLNHS